MLKDVKTTGRNLGGEAPAKGARAEDMDNTRVLRVIYLFAGKKRRNDIGSKLEHYTKLRKLRLVMREVDLLIHGSSDDILDDKVWNQVVDELKQGKYDTQILSPPCNGFTRAKWANNQGPAPLRSRRYQRGYPWLTGKQKETTVKENTLVDRSIQAIRAGAKSEAATRWLLEHPEDLGDTSTGGTPASIWQWPEIVELLEEEEATEGALHQCRYPGAASAKPTRLAGTLLGLEKMLYVGPTAYDEQSMYIGPLPRGCGHAGHPPLIGWDKEKNAWRTGPSSDYPGGMCEDIATIIVEDFLTRGRHDTLVAPKKDNPVAPMKDTPVAPMKENTPVAPMKENTPVAPIKDTPVAPIQAGEDTKREASEKTAGEGKDFWKKVMRLTLSKKTTLSENKERHWHTLVRAHDTSDEDEDGMPRTKLGDGVIGRGPPMTVWQNGSRKGFHDGAGLCSPGRWTPELRRVEKLHIMRALRARLVQIVREMDVKRLVATLACGRARENPFTDDMIRRGREAWAQTLRQFGGRFTTMKPPQGQGLLFAEIGDTLKLCGDPDWRVWQEAKLHTLERGVGLGVRWSLPRCPAVYERKMEWRAYEDSLSTDAPKSKTNYRSLEPAIEAIVKQFKEEEAEGMMEEISLEEAKKRYHDKELLIAALAAIQKTDDSFRVLHDGTHEVLVNPRIIMRDQMRCPGVPEQRALMKYAKQKGTSVFALKGDISKAHRRVLVREEDWGLQACQLIPTTIWLNRVGTFGIGSAAYWWSRLVGGTGRLTMYLMLQANIWQLAFADDLEWVVQGADLMINLTLAIFFQVLMGLPFAWHKFAGGVTLEWVGYWLDYSRFAIGISEARARWLEKWCKEVLMNGGVKTNEMEEVLGRLGFAANALWHIRPWLGPLYAWVSATPSGCFLALPVTMKLILIMIQKEMSRGVATAALQEVDQGSQAIFRADAMASETRVGIGGYEEIEGRPAQNSPWFSEEITQAQAPWLFVHGKDQTFRKIAALEMIATTACVRLFGDDLRHNGRLIKLAGETDNKGNAHVVAKLLTTKFPLCVTLMQLSHDMGERGVDLDLMWIPREENTLADALSNGEIGAMDPGLRRRFDIQSLERLNHLLQVGKELYDKVAEVKRKRGPT